jgi:S1-C subfamily serine protease
VILRFAESTISDIKSLQTGLRSHKPGDMVKVVVRRGEKDVTCNVTLGRP